MCIIFVNMIFVVFFSGDGFAIDPLKMKVLARDLVVPPRSQVDIYHSVAQPIVEGVINGDSASTKNRPP